MPDEQPIDNGAGAGVVADGAGNPSGQGATDPGTGTGTPASETGGGTPPADGTGTPAAEVTPDTPSGDVSDDYSDLYDKLDDENVDPNAPKNTPAAQPPADPAQFLPESYPEEVRTALGNNGYINDGATMAQAVDAAGLLWDVQTGKSDAWSTLVDPVRNYAPERYNSVVQELARGLTAATGMALVKLDENGNIVGRFNDKPVDPQFAAMQKEWREIKQRDADRAAADQKAQEDASRAKFVETVSERLSSLTKGTWMEGEDVVMRVLQQMDANKVEKELARTDMEAWLKQFDRAFKQVKNGEIDRVKRLSQNIVQHRQRLRSSTPAAPGSGAGNVKPFTPSGQQPQRSQFPEGEEGTRQWHSALIDHANA